MDTGDTAGAKNDGSRVKKRRCDKWIDNTDWLDGDEGLTKQLLSFDRLFSVCG